MNKNKIALITGGSRGLGRDMAFALASEGIDVIVTYVTAQQEAEVVVDAIRQSGRKAAALYFDAENLDQLPVFKERLISLLLKNWETESFDFLIHNVGIGASIPLADTTMQDFDRFTNIHFKTPYFLTQLLLPYINDNGALTFVSSGSTRVAIPGYSLYASLKSAIETLSRYVAKESGSRGIRSNVIAPGAIETDFNNGANRDDENKKTFIRSQTALGRTGKPEDIGSVVSFLCSDNAKWITGQRIEISGGWLL